MRFAPPTISQAGKEDCLNGSRYNSKHPLLSVKRWLTGTLLVLPRTLLALLTTLSLIGANVYAQDADEQHLLLAQATTIAQSQTPRVISKPQVVTTDDQTATANDNTAKAGNDISTSVSGTEPSNTLNDTVSDILKLLPDAWRAKIEQLTGSTTDASNPNLVRKIALPALGVLALILILPFILGALLKRIFRRRPAELSAPHSHDERLAELDLDDIDFSATDARPGVQRAAEPVEKTLDVPRAVEPVAAIPDVAAEMPQAAVAPAQQTASPVAQAMAPDDEPGQQTLSADSTMVLDHGYGEDSRTLTTHPVIDDIQAPDHYNSGTDATIGTQTTDRTPAAAGVNHELPDVDDVTAKEGIKTMTGMQTNPAHQTAQSRQPPAPANTLPTEAEEPRPMTKFGLWLNQLPSDLGSRYSIEALLYWVSYGAGKVKPGLREELNNAAELDNHGRIKKAVLTTRPEVLNDVLLSVHSNFSSAQQLQILDLMLAVLVSGDGIKPVENLFLRFYCDYTGMGLETLERRYREGFNAELPGIPRPDRQKWWEKQTASDIKNANTTGAMLGLTASASESEYQMALKLAEHRHDPSRFDLLGDKERSLVARNLQKYQSVVEARLETEA